MCSLFFMLNHVDPYRDLDLLDLAVPSAHSNVSLFASWELATKGCGTQRRSLRLIVLPPSAAEKVLQSDSRIISDCMTVLNYFSAFYWTAGQAGQTRQLDRLSERALCLVSLAK